MQLAKQFLLYIFITVFISCAPETSVLSEVQLFDINKFFLAEIEKLEQENKNLDKTIVVKSKSESINIESPNWKKEFQLFLETDISSKTYIDQYKVDTINNSIQYKALNEKLSIRDLQVKYSDNKFSQVTEISILKKTENVISKMEQLLNYKAGKNYSFQINQKMPFIKAYELTCKGIIE